MEYHTYLLFLILLCCYHYGRADSQWLQRKLQRPSQLPKSDGLLSDQIPVGTKRLLWTSHNKRQNIFRKKHLRSSKSHDHSDTCIPDPDANSGKGGKGRSSRSSKGKGGKGRGSSSRSKSWTSKGKGKGGRRRERHKRNSKRVSSRRLRGAESEVLHHRSTYGGTRKLYERKAKGGKGRSHGGKASCPPGFVPRPPRASSKEELQFAIQRYIKSDGEDSFYGPPINFWDVSEITDFSNLFKNADTFNESIGDWGTSQVTNMASMFRGAALFNQDISQWDVSGVTEFSNMFQAATSFNQPLSEWSTRSATDFSGLFGAATDFNQNINSWDVSSVTNFSEMFRQAISFNQPLNRWSTRSARTFAGTFRFATAFNQNINSWDVSSATDFSEMFRDAYAFNQPLHQWSTGSATDFYGLFCVAMAFNQNINSWDVSSVTDFSEMFREATSFNQPLSQWSTVSAQNFYGFFCIATSFNQDINSWNVVSVTDFSNMFQEASSFDQDISSWSVVSGTTFQLMFDRSSLSQNLCNWGIDMETAPVAIDVDGMFRGTRCPSTADPNLTANPMSPLCHFCTVTPPIVLYSNDFESPNRDITSFGPSCFFFDLTPVNDNYGTPENQFSQAFSVETYIITGSIVDPDGRAGSYALSMLASANNDLLSLGFNLQGRRYVRVTLDVSPIACTCNDGSIGCSEENADAILRVSLIDDPSGSVPVTSSSTNTFLDYEDIAAPQGPNGETLQWTRQTVILDSQGSAGQIAVNFDGIAGGYMVFDNLVIEAIDTPLPT